MRHEHGWQLRALLMPPRRRTRSGQLDGLPNSEFVGSMSNDFQIDDADRAIVEQLRLNGRATNQQIANTLGLTAATVSARIRRMEEANKLRVVAVSDFSAHGYNVLMEVAIEVDGRPATDVARNWSSSPKCSPPIW
jgi:DNA-binding CsgD family transcriptional regulator